MKIQRATLLFLIKDRKILLALKKKGFGRGFWNGVGGKIEPNETPRSAAIRETQEEILVTPKDFKKVAALNFVFAKTDSTDVWMEKVLVYLCNNWEGKPSETKEMKPKWFNFSDIPYSKMWPDDIIWLPRVLVGKKIKAKFWFDENNRVKKHNIWDID